MLLGTALPDVSTSLRCHMQSSGLVRHVFRLLDQALRDRRGVPWVLLENVSHCCTCCDPNHLLNLCLRIARMMTTPAVLHCNKAHMMHWQFQHCILCFPYCTLYQKVCRIIEIMCLCCLKSACCSADNLWWPVGNTPAIAIQLIMHTLVIVTICI